MRPTIDEQLDGARRLLEALGREEDLSAGGRARLRDADRLLRRVRGGWAATLPFLLTDNAALTTLLAGMGVDGDPPGGTDGTDVGAVAARNERLRERLAGAVRALPPPPADEDTRAHVAAYLRWRVDTDPT